MKQPMLAGKVVDVNNLTYPVIASPKLDGIRCLMEDGVAYSRKLKPIPNKYIQSWALSWRDELHGMDGELIVGDPTSPDCYNVTSSGVMSVSGQPAFTFYIFDVWNLEQHYEWRLLQALIKTEEVPLAITLKSRKTRSRFQLEEYEQECVDNGYEGIMVRSPSSPYKNGRSTAREGYLLKLKRFEDDEATITGWDCRWHNANDATLDETGHTKRSTRREGLIAEDTLGTIEVRNSKGQCFNIGSGFTDLQRKTLWENRMGLIGKLVKYRYQPAGEKDAPRFPTFIGFRSEDDL